MNRKMLDDLIGGLARQPHEREDRIMDNTSLAVDTRQALADHAARLGKTAEEMTPRERVEAVAVAYRKR